VVVGCSLSAAALAYGLWRVEHITHYQVETIPAADGEPENYLIVGSDSRESVDPDDPNADVFLNGESGGARSDSMMVARIDPREEQVHLLSVPRDLWVTIPGGDPDEHHRINEAFAGGRQQLIDTVSSALGIEINHYVEVDFGGFQELVDAIDGVPMYFDTAWRDEHSGLNISGEGCVTLDGHQGLAFARARHLEFMDRRTGEWESDPTGDFGRMNRQQLLVVNAFDRAVSLELANPAHLNRLINIGVDNVGVDEGFTFDDMVALAKAFADTDSDHVVRHGLAVEDYTTGAGAAVLRLLEDESEPVLRVFRGSEPGAVAEGDVTVAVINGTGADGQAQAVADALAEVGFVLDGTDTNPGPPLATTQIRYAVGSTEAAELVERHLTAGAELVEDPALAPGSVRLITGLDFTTVMRVPREDTSPPPQTDEADEESTTTSSSSTTSTTVGGHTGEPPEGVECQ
jgi:LCP family protein required for cell wall assembly